MDSVLIITVVMGSTVALDIDSKTSDVAAFSHDKMKLIFLQHTAYEQKAEILTIRIHK